MKPIFIGGCQRSGTTLLASMLASAPGIVAVPESPFKFELWSRETRLGGTMSPQAVKADLDRSLRYRIWGVEVSEKELASGDWMEAVVRRYAAQHGEPDPTHWVDHTPENIRHASTLRERYPDAHIVHIVRDGRAAMNSIFALNWGPDDPVTAARWWSQAVGAGLAAEVAGAHRVYYEDLVLNPRETLMSLCEALGLDYVPGMEGGRGFDLPAYTADQHRRVGTALDASRIANWKYALPRRAVEVFESRTGDLLPLLGYEPEFGIGARPPSLLESAAYALRARGTHFVNRIRQQARLRRAASGRSVPVRVAKPPKEAIVPAPPPVRSAGPTKRATLTACTIAKDEERDLQGWLANTLQFCDEAVVVVDAETTDSTRDVLREAKALYGDRVVWTERARDEETGFSGQRNACLPLATSDWALHMDVDMRVTPELAAHILSGIQDRRMNAYNYRLLNHFLQHPIRGGGWSKWNKAWLGRRGSHRFVNLIHEVTEIEGGDDLTGQLEGFMWHLNDENYVERVTKNVQYMQESGRSILERGIQVRWYHMLLYPSYRAFRTYVMQGGWRDGSLGFLHSMMTLATIFNWWGYAWDVQNRVAREDLEKFLDQRWMSASPLRLKDGGSEEVVEAHRAT